MKTLLIKATTNSEWDSVDFALVTLTTEFCKEIVDAHKEATRVKRICPSLGNIVLDYDIDWYINDDNHTEVIKLFQNDIDYRIAENEIKTDDFPIPENSIRYGTIKVHEHLGIQFVATGKHTNEEFWTDYLPITIFKNFKAKRTANDLTIRN